MTDNDLIDLHSTRGLKETIAAIQTRISRIRQRMESLKRLQGKMEPHEIAEWAELNDKLRKWEIYRTEFKWLKNQL